MTPADLSRISAAMRAFAVLVLLAATSIADARPLKFDFSGSITDDPFGLLSGDFSLQGTYTFDTAASDVVPESHAGVYVSTGPQFGFDALIGGTAYTVSGSNEIAIANDLAGGIDQYTALATEGPLTLELFLQADTGNPLTDDHLLSTNVPTLSLFDIAQFRLFGDGVEFLGRVMHLDCAECEGSPVPEPATSSLMILAALLLVARACRRFSLKRLLARGAFAVLVGTMSVSAMAIDGVVLIDQSKASTGNVTPGDGPGFPIVISQPGSYRLTSMLTVPDIHTTAIEITASHVTLDLNGFAIVGSFTCSADAANCFGFDPAGNGVHAGAAELHDITVRNGSISGMGGCGILLAGTGHSVDRLEVDNNGINGIDISGGAAEVTHSIARLNGNDGFHLQTGNISYSTAAQNFSVGFRVNEGIISYSFAKENQLTTRRDPLLGFKGFGFFAPLGSTACIGNVAALNDMQCTSLGHNRCDGLECGQ